MDALAAMGQQVPDREGRMADGALKSRKRWLLRNVKTDRHKPAHLRQEAALQGRGARRRVRSRAWRDMLAGSRVRSADSAA